MTEDDEALAAAIVGAVVDGRLDVSECFSVADALDLPTTTSSGSCSTSMSTITVLDTSRPHVMSTADKQLVSFLLASSSDSPSATKPASLTSPSFTFDIDDISCHHQQPDESLQELLSDNSSSVSPEVTSSSSSSSEKLVTSGGGQQQGGGQAAKKSRKGIGGRRKNPPLSVKERTVRRLASNERERMRMHGLNAAFEVCYRSKFERLRSIFSITSLKNHIQLHIEEAYSVAH